ncbi:biosynthetic arginine decarboxylase [Acidobacteriota bacterium]|nr:biosynthetic arginine decarboxylase [Acidobacteriota bacterium]
MPLKWTVQDSAKLYAIDEWGDGYFGTNAKGRIVAMPTRDESITIDLYEAVLRLKKLGVQTPVTLRFPQILEGRIKEIDGAFEKAIAEFNYNGDYNCIYPVKTNQIKEVVQEIVKVGNDYKLGLECGSKPELILALSINLHPDSLILCNGYKDEGFIKMALLARKAGRRIVITVEKMSELQMILKIAKSLKVKPLIGLRAKLNAQGSGKWETSAGDHAKFGLTTREILEAVDILRKKKMLDSIIELHFHIGSQITDIRKVKIAVKEATRIYAKLRKMDVPIEYMNVGGGLAVDYDGSKTTFTSSMNYTLEQYASDVVYNTKDICKMEDVPVPKLLTESGRALTAYHEVVIVDVIGLIDTTHSKYSVEVSGKEIQIIKDLSYIRDNIGPKNYSEMYSDAVASKDEINSLFNLGYLSLEDRSKGETLFWEILRKLSKILTHKSIKYIPEEFRDLNKSLADKFIANFSIFQTIPDHWAIEQLFPVAPIHRLKEKPTLSATLCDITCDSDGTVEKFVDLKDVRDEIALHEPSDEPYFIGIFLTGAYQDILGMRHNLFGAPSEAFLIAEDEDNFRIDKVIPAETIDDMLRSVHFNPESMGRISINGRKIKTKVDASEDLHSLIIKHRGSHTYLSTEED